MLAGWRFARKILVSSGFAWRLLAPDRAAVAKYAAQPAHIHHWHVLFQQVVCFFYQRGELVRAISRLDLIDLTEALDEIGRRKRQSFGNHIQPLKSEIV